MHELPKDLSRSLRSWRGSVYRDSGEHQRQDVEKGRDDYGSKSGENYAEKGPDDYGEKNSGDGLTATQTSLVPHPTHSSRGLRQQWLNQGGQEQEEQGGESARGYGYGYNGQYQQAPSSPTSPQQARRNPGQSSMTALPKKQTTFSTKRTASPKRSIFSQPKVEDPDPAASRLDDDPKPLTKEDFYQLIGMHAPRHKGQNPRQLATPGGLYGRIHSMFKYVQRKYRIFDIATYALLILQVLLSAVFIVLGSLSRIDSHIAIAVLGAVSTVVAGVLALMKGQGLPNRLRQTRDALRNVLFEAEELYWDVGADRPVLYKDIEKIREDYLRVMEEARKNHPDTWTAAATKLAEGASGASGTKAKTPAGASGASLLRSK